MTFSAMLKRRIAIAHGQQEYIQQDGIDDLVARHSRSNDPLS